jgi:predicted metal-dependent phosphoesterase TrpH
MTFPDAAAHSTTLLPRTAIDLHTHTTASDGLLTPADLTTAASRRGIAVLGITDHDTIDGLPDAIGTGQRIGITVVPGVELSTTMPGPEIHILGYFVDIHDPIFFDRLAALTHDRVNRISKVVQLLNDAGYPVEMDAILSQANEGSIGRPHVARALIELGAATDMNDAFVRFLKRGAVGWAPRSPFSAEEAVSILVDNGAMPVLAHPFSTRDVRGTIERLVPAGMRGLEVYYGEYDTAQQEELLVMAREFDLIPTGGSDFHGHQTRDGRDLGAVNVPDHVWDRLQAARLTL